MTLIANALSCERNGRVVFSGLNFTIAPGEMAELRGPNGAGKSSLLRLIAGLVPVAEGTLSRAPSGDDAIAQQCHYIGHHEALKNVMTVQENLAFWVSMLGATMTPNALDVFGLTRLANDPVQLLSAGQRRRLALTRLIAVHRAIWLLDEPNTALDSASKAVLAHQMDSHLGKGGIILVATHGDLHRKPNHHIALGPSP